VCCVQIFTRPEWSLRARRSGDVSQEAALEAAAARGSAAAGGAAAAAATNWALVSAAEVTAAVRAGALSPADVDALDKSALRSALLALDLPSAGKQQDLRDRLRAALSKDKA
jgi:hypothetical protein